jgi:hypothetical protein
MNLVKKNSSSISNQILDELITTIEIIGIDSTIRTLQDAKTSGLLMQDSNVDFILHSISKITSVSKERITDGNDRSDDRKFAVAASVYFIKKECNYSLSELKLVFNKDVSALSRYNSMVENLSKKPKTEFDKKLDGIVKKMNILLKEKKLQNGKQI